MSKKDNYRLSMQDLKFQTDEEKRAFERWLGEGCHEELWQEWNSSSEIQKELILLHFLETRREKNLNRFMKALDGTPHRRNMSRWTKWSVAASILVLVVVSMSWWVLNSSKNSGKYIATEYEAPSLTVAPSLSYKLKDGVYNVECQGVNIRIEPGRVAYTRVGQQSVVADSLRFNELVVPRGQMCEVELVDGTRVVLNSDSRLRFPVSFKDSLARLVYLNGEAYFDVASDADHPFIVKSPHLEARVYGTKFNIKSYNRDALGRIMLEEGRLNVIGHDRKVKTMQPGDYYAYDGSCLVESRSGVDAYEVTCWRDYKFCFNNEMLMDIATDLERKYDVNIYFDNYKASTFRFYSRTHRCEHVEDVLDLFHFTEKIDYHVDGRDIYIKLHE